MVFSLVDFGMIAVLGELFAGECNHLVGGLVESLELHDVVLIVPVEDYPVFPVPYLDAPLFGGHKVLAVWGNNNVGDVT
jgi:hypothetical protein